MALDMGNAILPVVYTFQLIAVPTFISVTFYVTGGDNMVPTFPMSMRNLSIAERDSPGSWPMDLATDYDEGMNSTQNYYIDNPALNSTFYLDPKRDSTGRITTLQLRSRGAIDREQTPSFSFTIVAEEGRPNTSKGYQRIFITVEDVCDSVPVFPITSYRLEVPENTPINTVVLTLKAIDLDIGSNALLTYSISSQCPQGSPCQSGSVDGFAPFAMDSVSGNLTLVQKLDFDKAKLIDLSVIARNPCNLVGAAQVQVTVVYVNNKPPGIQIVLVNDGVIKDDYTLRSDVATVTVTSLVNFTVDVLDSSSGLVSDTFSLVNLGSSYRMRLLRTLDSKVRSSYNVTVRATDVGSNVAYSSVTILVRGVNHPPTFDVKAAFVSVPDNIINGTKVLGAHASDSDVGGNGVVTYDLPPPNATYVYQNNFTVTAASGDVLVNGVLDRKVARTFLLLVRARDNPTDGEPSFSDYMVVNVTLLDPVINRPIFPPQPSQVNVSENILVGSTIFQVVAYLKGTITRYSSVPSAFFQIDSISGVIRVVGTLDYSTTRQYVLNITAYGDGFPLPSTYTLTINILPGDAVGPVFAPRVYNVQVMRTAAVGSHVADIKAVDTFSPAVLYEIVDGNGEGKFTINPTTGTISVLSRLDQAGTQTYTLHVKASDENYYSKWLAEVVISVNTIPPSDTTYPVIYSTVSRSPTVPTAILQQSHASSTSDIPLTFIIGAVGGGVLLLAVAFVIVLIAITVRRSKRRPVLNIAFDDNGVNSGSNRLSVVLTSSEQSHQDPPPQSTQEATTSGPHTPQSQRIPSKEDLVKGEPVYRTSSLKAVPHARSTSDLASTVGTEVLSGVEDTGPYTKAQLMAIYAANAQLLQDNVSQDSVHMFGSEGGVEADEVDIDHMMFGKTMGFEDEDEVSVMDEDCTSIQQPVLQEQKARRIADKEPWLPSVGSESDDAPRYDNMYSQSSSTFSQAFDEGRDTQTFRTRQSLDGRGMQDRGYYNEAEQRWSPRYRLPAGKRSLPDMYIATPLPRQMNKLLYSSTQEGGPASSHHDHHLKYSQDLTCPDGSHVPNLLHHTPLSGTETDDGNNVNSSSAHQGVGPSCYYASSSSIASTNLSQTVPRSHNLYNPSL